MTRVSSLSKKGTRGPGDGRKVQTHLSANNADFEVVGIRWDGLLVNCSCVIAEHICHSVWVIRVHDKLQRAFVSRSSR